MRKSRCTEEQIIGFIKQAEAGMPVKELCRKGGFSDATFYKWRAKYGARTYPMPGGGVSWRVRTPNSSACWPKPIWIYPRAECRSRGKALASQTKREAILIMVEQFELSKCRACRPAGVSRANYCH
jgi:putative transposase